MTGITAPFIVIETDILSRGIPPKRIFMSSTESMATPAAKENFSWRILLIFWNCCLALFKQYAKQDSKSCTYLPKCWGVKDRFIGGRTCECNKDSIYSIFGREPWSSDYGRRLTFWRSWVRILVLYTGWTFFHINLLQNCTDVYLKNNPKINEKEAVNGSFLKKLIKYLETKSS